MKTILLGSSGNYDKCETFYICSLESVEEAKAIMSEFNKNREAIIKSTHDLYIIGYKRWESDYDKAMTKAIKVFKKEERYQFLRTRILLKTDEQELKIITKERDKIHKNFFSPMKDKWTKECEELRIKSFDFIENQKLKNILVAYKNLHTLFTYEEKIV